MRTAMREYKIAAIPGDGIGVGFKDFPGLAAGASLASTLVVNLPESFVAGGYFLSAVADAGNAIPETGGAATLPVISFMRWASPIMNRSLVT